MITPYPKALSAVQTEKFPDQDFTKIRILSCNEYLEVMMDLMREEAIELSSHQDLKSLESRLGLSQTEFELLMLTVVFKKLAENKSWNIRLFDSSYDTHISPPYPQKPTSETESSLKQIRFINSDDQRFKFFLNSNIS